MRPLIGITVESTHDPDDARSRGKLTLNWNYAEAIADAGGLPLLIPPVADMKQLASMIDGWLIPGGFDIDAQRFGESNHPKVELQDPARYECEAELFSCLDPEIPIFGICYGCQFLNVVRGGNLIQHIPDDVDSESHAGGTLQHYTVAESQLRNVVAAEMVAGKSYHHQSVSRLGSNLRVVATAEDGIVEGIEATDRPYLIGVQWHPERTLEDPASRRLFERFVDAARDFADRRRGSTPHR